MENDNSRNLFIWFAIVHIVLAFDITICISRTFDGDFILNKNELVFGKDAANAAFDMLLNAYSNRIDFYIQDYEVQNKYGCFMWYDQIICPNRRPEIFLWSPSSQQKLLVLIHELAHYHHCTRNDHKTFISYTKIKAEAYTYYIGWCLIKRYRLDFISKDVWEEFSYWKLWRSNVGLEKNNYKQIEQMTTGEVDAMRLRDLRNSKKLAA